MVTERPALRQAFIPTILSGVAATVLRNGYALRRAKPIESIVSQSLRDRRSNPTLTFALCASLSLHALLVVLAAWWFVRGPARFTTISHLPETRAPIIMPPPPPPPQENPTRQPTPHPAAEPLRDDSGEQHTNGSANRSTPGEQPMQARQGLEQADLTRGKSADADESQSRVDTAPKPADTSGITEATPPTPVGISEDTTPGPAPRAAPVPPPPAPAPAVVAAVAPASHSDTDSVPFTRANHATFKNGQMVGRLGRRVRTTHIAFGLAAEADAISLADPRVVLGVTVDAAGNVQNVVVLRSSGSDSIDLPSQNAVYNWWFEPLKNPAGRGLPDVWVVTIE